jgi:carbonic anhydrase/acetyltransferase-like protein (isoleucine patch superfamily)
MTIGRDVTVGHMVMLHGCTIADECLIGIGSVILNRVKVGRHCIIGANSLIPEGKEIPERSLVMGSPGKVVRQVTDDEVAFIKWHAEHYAAKIPVYREQLVAKD